MIKATPVFQSKWYHLIMAAIYFLAGVFILYKGYSGADTGNTIIIGWLLCIYGTYRLVSKWLSFKKVEKVND